MTLKQGDAMLTRSYLLPGRFTQRITHTRPHCSRTTFMNRREGLRTVPITNYKAKALKAENRLFDDPDIPEQTKRTMRRFLTAYDVSYARRVIFLQKICPVLKAFSPIQSALTDRDGMNEFFARLRQHYSPATYATYINVTKRFLTWLNEGEKPISLMDVKPGKKSDRKRNLKPEDMVNWEEGVLLGNAAFNVQIAAAGQTQLDCGFRPSEFIDLNYGDVTVHTGLAVFEVDDDHKTGRRSVVAHRCVPALLKWLENHPTKNPADPLWVLEKTSWKTKNGRLLIDRYPYAAIAKRIRNAGRRAGITKPLDFYNLRHSSCVLDKMDNLPVDLAAERHGHSVKHFVETYGRLSIKDVMRRFHSHYGLEKEEEPKAVTNKTCRVCDALNAVDTNWCSSCGTPFNTQGALETAKAHGLIRQNKDAATRGELEQLKADLAASRKREDNFRKEQMLLLRQVQDIRSALSGKAALQD